MNKKLLMEVEIGEGLLIHGVHPVTQAVLHHVLAHGALVNNKLF